MSGVDRAAVVFVATTPDAFAVKALSALGALPARLPTWALVGGVSVAVNLNGFHRPTGDLDTVSIDADSALELLVEQGAQQSRNGVTIASGSTFVDVDIIDVSGGDPHSGAYLAHSFALETAVNRLLRVVSSSSRETLVEVTVPVATPTAIVAMKLHSVEGRRDSRPDKRSGDIYDVVRIVGAFGAASIAAELRRTAPRILVSSTTTMCKRYFVDEVDRSFRWLRMDSRSAVSDVERSDLLAVGELVVQLN